MGILKIEDNRIYLDKLDKCKKITGTRLANLFGLNRWNTAFQTWCQITKVYEPPFVDNKYVLAGKVIESKVVKFLREKFFMEDLVAPEDVYGQDFFKKTYGDFFHEDKIFGGMWDARGKDYVVEIKTTKRSEDWINDAPLYYKLQAALYCYLLGLDKFIMPVVFLNEEDYPIQREDGTWDTTPCENLVISNKNCLIREYSLCEEFPTFKEDFIDKARVWYDTYVLGLVSPDYDEKVDKDYITAIRKNVVEVKDDTLLNVLKEADDLRIIIDKETQKIQDEIDRLKLLETHVKDFLSTKFKEGGNNVEVKTDRYVYNLSKQVSEKFDYSKFKKENAELFKKYSSPEEKYTLRKKALKD